MERADLDLSDADRKSIVTQSIEDEDLLVGYQVVLLSKSTGKPKGLYVILGVQKFRFSATQYLLRSQGGEDKWAVLQKNNVVKGKQFLLKRKVVASLT
jgi:hypothetical protein